MALTEKSAAITRGSRSWRGAVLASGTLASVLLLGCSTEPDDVLNDPSQSPTASAAMQASTPPLVQQSTPTQGSKGTSADVTVKLNHSPVVTNILSDVGRLDAGDLAQLRVVAHDPDGDRLTYAWTTECEGSFDRPSSPTPRFNLYVLPAAGSCRLLVTVTDDHGGQTEGILTLAAAPSPAIVVAEPPQDS